MSSFKKRVKQIADAEKDVDRVLKAAKLQRHPKQHDPMMFEYILAIAVIVCMFAAYIVPMFLIMSGR